MSRRTIVVILITAVAGLSFARRTGAERPALRQYPGIYTEKINSIPDMTQTDPAAKLPNGGRSHCGPVAVSNSLMWLAGNGFENLSPNLQDRRKAHFEIARSLST